MHVLSKKFLIATGLTVLVAGSISPAWAQNSLAIGKGAKQAGWVDIPINLPANLNFKSQNEVLTMRKRALMNHKALLAGDYEPTPDVFGAIEDGRPWWGLAGSHVWGRGDRSIAGLAEESRFILNPYLLVAVNPATLLIWNQNLVTQKDADNPAFPFSWTAQGLRWNPKEATAEVTYDVTKWHQDIVHTGKLGKPAAINQFSLVVYNARDLGMKYVMFDESKSKNVKNDFVSHFPAEIRQMIHCGGTCGYPGGCNNMSPFMREIDRLRLTAVPAQAVVKLWKEAPDWNTPPDMVWRINFK